MSAQPRSPREVTHRAGVEIRASSTPQQGPPGHAGAGVDPGCVLVDVGKRLAAPTLAPMLRPHRALPPRLRLALSCERDATLFDADEAPYAATVEVLGVIFSAEDDGYAVLEVQDAESGEGFALVGPVAHLGAGDRAEVSGEWQTHSRYGRQLRARGALPLDPADREGQIAYLTSLRHIGPARAERLVDEHGEGVLGAIAADPTGVFGALRGVSAKQAAAAAESWHASRAVRDLHVQLAPHGLAHLGGADPRPLRRALDWRSCTRTPTG